MLKTRPTALIITKSAIKGAFFRKHLGKYEVIVTDDEQEVVNKLQSLNISLVVIDEKTPKINPIELCQFIRSCEEYQNIPIFVITVSLKKSWFRDLLNSGASDFLSDPLDAAELEKRLAVSANLSKTQKKMGLITKKFPKTKMKASFQGRFLLNEAVLKKISNSLKEKEQISLLIAEVDQFEEKVASLEAQIVEEISGLLEDELKKLLRAQDILIPMGIGKYIILLPKTSNLAAQHFAELIRDDVKNVAFATEKGSFNLTISIGLITGGEREKEESTYQHLDRLLTEAGQCLEKAKRKGNQIVSKQKKSS